MHGEEKRREAEEIDRGGERKSARAKRKEHVHEEEDSSSSSRNFFHARITLPTLSSDALNNGDKGECRGNITIIARMMDNDRGGCLSRPLPPPSADHYSIEFNATPTITKLTSRTFFRASVSSDRRYFRRPSLRETTCNPAIRCHVPAA